VTECTQTRPAQTRTAPVRTAQVRTAQVRTAQVRTAQLRPSPVRTTIGAAMAAVLVALAVLGLTRPPAARAAATARTAVSAGGAAASAARRHPRGVSRRLRLKAWHWALRQRGKPYIWGGVGPRGFDCSGLVQSAYRSVGIDLPRTTYEMLDSRMLIRIRKSQAHRGDLAFFGREHVELYRYGNWTFGAEHTGTRVGFHRMNRFWHPTMYFRVR
jgi:cell wall-associated NlpC family hydrolase